MKKTIIIILIFAIGILIGWQGKLTHLAIIEEFPEDAESVDLGQKDILFLNVAYQQVEVKASRDSSIIRSLCKEQIEELNITI